MFTYKRERTLSLISSSIDTRQFELDYQHLFTSVSSNLVYDEIISKEQIAYFYLNGNYTIQKDIID